MPRAILFDLDETLIDRTQSIVQYAERLQQDWEDRLRPTAVSSLAEIILTADQRGYRPRAEVFADLVQHLPWQTPPEVAAISKHWNTWFPLVSVARQGLTETLATLHAQGLRLGVITNGGGQRQQRKIDALQIRGYLATVIVSETVQIAKPDPRIFALALAEIDCTAAQTWFVGDHPVNDILGATAAGLRAIWLTGIHPWPETHPAPRWHIASLPELLPLLHQEHQATATS